MSRVETVVLDPGDYSGQFFGYGQPCRVIHGGCYTPAEHDWQIVGLADHSSTWHCPRCRRIERRQLTAAPLAEGEPS